MQKTYISKKDFEKNCPCAFSITSFAESMMDNGTTMDLDYAYQSSSDENSYTAKFSFYPLYSIFDTESYCLVARLLGSEILFRISIVVKSIHPMIQ